MTDYQKALLIATRNQGKFEEIKQFLQSLNFRLISLKDHNSPNLKVKEKGSSFKENAEVKARFYGEKTGYLTLADDSGLLVDALPGKLGTKSKRYTLGSDKKRKEKLLKELKILPKNKRGARFITVLALFDPKSGQLKTARGVCEGSIAFQSRGKHGFGYDSVFIAKGLKKHLAQLSLEEKNQISARGQALKKIKKILTDYA